MKSIFVRAIIIPVVLGWAHLSMAQQNRLIQVKTNRQDYYLCGKVHSVLQNSILIKNNKINLKGTKKRLTLKNTVRIKFNKKGQLINCEHYDGNNLVKTEKFFYLKHGAIARRIVHSKKRIKQYWYVCNRSGDLIEVKVVTPGKWVTEDMRYISNGVLAIYTKRDLKEIVVSINLGNGYRIKKIYGQNRELSMKWLIKLNKNGKIIQKIYYKKMENRHSQEPQLVYGKRFIYNSKGDIKQIKKYKQGSLAASQNFSYTYDSHQNWIKKIIHKNGNPIKIIKRNITYF